jgi:predicted RNA binding protein YcfA (HicA-like mRNA interferase family)
MSAKLPRVTAIEILRALRRDGWVEARQRGSHVILPHDVKAGLVVVPMHKGKDLPVGLVSRILTDAGLTADDLRSLL